MTKSKSAGKQFKKLQQDGNKASPALQNWPKKSKSRKRPKGQTTGDDAYKQQSNVVTAEVSSASANTNANSNSNAKGIANTLPAITPVTTTHRAPKSEAKHTSTPKVHGLPDKPVQDTQVFKFGAGIDAYRPSYQANDSTGSSHRAPYEKGPALDDHPERVSFSFRSDKLAPKFQAAARPSGKHNHDRGAGKVPEKQRTRNGRPYSRFPPTSNRAIFQTVQKREATPERLQGMGGGNIQFKHLDDVSQNMGRDVEHETPRKRQKVDTEQEKERPQWSNPDPYTVLPPTYERTKRTDVVQLIRKAKVMLKHSTDPNNAIADNDDFVSLSFGTTAKDQEKQSSIHVEASAKAVPITNYSSLDAAARTANGPMPSTNNLGVSRKRSRVTTGAYKPEWIGTASIATPWIIRPFEKTDDMTWRLHVEIMDFYDYIKPRGYEKRVRQYLVNRVHNVLCRSFQDHRVLAFGSFAAGLYLPVGDMDLVLVSRQYEEQNISSMRKLTHKTMNLILDDLVYERVAQPAEARVISQAKVPIIKFIEHQTGLQVDISFENLTGVVANRTYMDWLSQFPDLPLLVSVIKQFLLMRGLNEVFVGGLGGFSITCLIVSFLQLQAGKGGDGKVPPNLGQLLIDFLDFYGRKFDMTRKVISINPPKYWDKQPTFKGGRVVPPAQKWSILDPNNPQNDISVGTSMAPLIARCFVQAADDLRQTMALVRSSTSEVTRRDRSILGCILGGNYSSFAKQRDHMRSLDDYYAATAH